MSVAVQTGMTREAFFGWAEAQNERHEFDGVAPVAMTGGTMGHSLIMLAVLRSLARALASGDCRVLGPEAGVATRGNAVRYPDAVVTCSQFQLSDRLVPDPVVVFEVISPTSGRMDRVVKLNEYQAVGSIRAYVIVESEAAAVTLLARGPGEGAFTASGLGAEDVLELPAIGVSVRVAEFYEGVEFDAVG